MSLVTHHSAPVPAPAPAPEAAAPVDATAPVDETTGLPELRLARPMPGFPGLSRFVLVQLDGGDEGEPADTPEGGDRTPSVLYELRSVERPEVSFLVAVPGAFFPDYTVDLDEQACQELGLTDAGDALVVVILTVGADPGATTANLLAPVVINARTRSAAQVILSGSDWPVRAAVA